MSNYIEPDLAPSGVKGPLQSTVLMEGIYTS